MKINFKVLDGLRGIAALYVVVNHSRGNLLIGGQELSNSIPFENWDIFTKIYYGILQLTSLGSEFVVIFFVLSGFSIAYSINNNSNIIQFYKKRLIRLYPPYILALIFAFITYKLINNSIYLPETSVFNSFYTLLKNILYISEGALIPQFWSLPLEMVFYILSPLIFFSKKGIKLYYILSIILFLVSSLYSITNINTSILTQYIFDYNIFFAIGIYLYYNFNLLITNKYFTSKKTLIISTLVLIPLMIFINHKFGHYNKISFLISALFSVILILSFLKHSISPKIFQFIGTMSYTLYITHYASLFLFIFLLKQVEAIEDLPISNPFIWIFGVIFSVIISKLLFYLGEKPSIQLLKRIRSNKK